MQRTKIEEAVVQINFIFEEQSSVILECIFKNHIF
jgi:hypothetical protein